MGSLTVTLTDLEGKARTISADEGYEDVYLINEKSYGYPEKLLDEDGDLKKTLFVNTGAVSTIEVS